MLELDGYDITWRFCEGESLTKMRHQYRSSYGYILGLVKEWLSDSQIKDIIYFQRHPNAPKSILKPKKYRFIDEWKLKHH